MADAANARRVAAAGFDGPVLAVPDERLFERRARAGRRARRPTTPR